MISCNCGVMVGSISRGGTGLFSRRSFMIRKGLSPVNGTLPRQHFVEHHAERIEIAAGIAALAFDLFRRNVVGRAHGLGEFGEGEPAGFGTAGDAEIDELDVVVFVDHYVFWLQVTMHDAGEWM